MESISKKWKEKPAAIVVCIVGTVLAIFIPILQYENFLYLIGSVFAPMIAILIADFFILKKNHSEMAFQWTNLILWAMGFCIYRVFLHFDTPVGNTLPVMVITTALCIIVNKIRISGGKKNA